MGKRADTRGFRSQVAPVLLGLLKAAGGDLTALARKYELPDDFGASAGEIEMPLSRFHAFTAEVEAALGDKFLGLHCAQMAPRGSYGVLEFTVRSAPNLREAFERVCRYSGLLNALAVFELKEKNGVARFEHRVPGSKIAYGRVGNEFTLSLCMRIGRELSQGRIGAMRVWFAHRRPDDVSELVEWFGTGDLIFDSGENAFTFDARLLDEKMNESDLALWTIMNQQAALLAKERAQANDFTGRVREQIRRSLQGGDASIGTVARALATSGRTLQRQLSTEGTRFHDLVEGVREEMAREYVANGMGLSEVAYVLGYSELSAFMRAFKRWTGTTPARFRATVDRPLARG